MFSNVDWKDLVVRAVKTFVQAAVAIFVAAEIASVGDVNLALVDQAVVAGGAALLSFVQNFLLSLSLAE